MVAKALSYRPMLEHQRVIGKDAGGAVTGLTTTDVEGALVVVLLGLVVLVVLGADEVGVDVVVEVVLLVLVLLVLGVLVVVG